MVLIPLLKHYHLFEGPTEMGLFHVIWGTAPAKVRALPSRGHSSPQKGRIYQPKHVMLGLRITPPSIQILQPMPYTAGPFLIDWQAH